MASLSMHRLKLLRFQTDWLKRALAPGIDTAVFSAPRGASKTFLAAHVLSRCMTPGDVLNEPGKEYILGAASVEQARLTYQFIRAALEGTNEYRWLDSATRLGATHKESNTKLRAISSNAKSSFGLVNVPLIVLDEPGALENVGGQMLSDSIFTAQGKVGSELRVLMFGTLAPMATQSGHWWWDLANSECTPTRYTKLLQGNAETWDQWPTIRKANPLVNLPGKDGAKFRAKLLEERDAARNR